MQVQPIALGAILKNYKVRVPTNQREYSWTARQVLTLFRDWATAINEPEYFLGAVVAVSRDPGQLEIVDGQQRLATTAIFLTVIRDFLKEHNEPQIAASIERDFLITSTRNRREDEPKLHLNLTDNEFFKGKIIGGIAKPSKPSHELIENAFVLAREHVEGIVKPLNPRAYGDVLTDVWVDFVQNRAKVILLEVPSSANAFRMFETLNDRGLKTTQADLVKNYLFSRAGDERGAEAQDKWASMRGALEALDDEDISTVTFLRHALTLIRGYLRERDVYDKVQDEAKSPGAAISLLDLFERLASDYVAMFNPESDRWRGYPDRMTESIATTKLLNIQPMWPLMLAVAVKFDQKEAAAAFKKFIAWQVRFLIAGSTLTGGSIEVPIAKAAKSVFDGEIAKTAQLSNALVATIPNDERFKAAFAVATVSKPELARYYLRALERVATNQAEPWFVPNDDREVINLEHVLPLKTRGNWAQFDPAVAKVDARRIGNLALLSNQENRELGSSSFEEKRVVYEGSPYALTAQIGKVGQWSHEEIVARQEALSGLALRAWPL